MFEEAIPNQCLPAHPRGFESRRYLTVPMSVEKVTSSFEIDSDLIVPLYWTTRGRVSSRKQLQINAHMIASLIRDKLVAERIESIKRNGLDATIRGCPNLT